jgi:hypothetical protein
VSMLAITCGLRPLTSRRLPLPTDATWKSHDASWSGLMPSFSAIRIQLLPAQGPRSQHRLNSVAHLELSENGRDVILHGRLRQIKLASHQGRQDVELSAGEAKVCWLERRRTAGGCRRCLCYDTGGFQ